MSDAQSNNRSINKVKRLALAQYAISAPQNSQFSMTWDVAVQTGIDDI